MKPRLSTVDSKKYLELQQWSKRTGADLKALSPAQAERALADVGLSAADLARLTGTTTAFVGQSAGQGNRLSGELAPAAATAVPQRDVFGADDPLEALRNHPRPVVADYTRALAHAGFTVQYRTESGLGEVWRGPSGQSVTVPTPENLGALGVGGDAHREAFLAALASGTNFSFPDAALGSPYSMKAGQLSFTMPSDYRLWTVVPRVLGDRSGTSTKIVGSEFEALFPGSTLFVRERHGRVELALTLASSPLPAHLANAEAIARSAGGALSVRVGDGSWVELRRVGGGLLGTLDEGPALEHWANFVTTASSELGVSVDSMRSLDLPMERGTLVGSASLKTMLISENGRLELLVGEPKAHPELMPTPVQVRAAAIEAGKAISKGFDGTLVAKVSSDGTTYTFDGGELVG